MSQALSQGVRSEEGDFYVLKGCEHTEWQACNEDPRCPQSLKYLLTDPLRGKFTLMGERREQGEGTRVGRRQHWH